MVLPKRKIPTVEIVGSGGRVVINESDLPQWEAKGYKCFTEAEAEAPVAEVPAPETPAEKEAEVKETKAPKTETTLISPEDVMGMTSKDIDTFVEGHDVEVNFPRGAKVAEKRQVLIDALEEEE